MIIENCFSCSLSMCTHSSSVVSRLTISWENGCDKPVVRYNIAVLSGRDTCAEPWGVPEPYGPAAF